jgi:hypothetical protein
VTPLSALLLTLAVQPPPQDQNPVANWACANPLIDNYYRGIIQGGHVPRERIATHATQIQLECARPYVPSMGNQVQYRVRVTLFELQIAGAISYRLGEAGIGQSSPGAEARADRVPSIFLGTWAVGREDCTTTGETTRVSIRAAELEFYESTGRVQRVAPVGAGPEYAVRVTFAGEGETWDGTIHLSRAADTLTLRDAEDQEARVYIRC